MKRRTWAVLLTVAMLFSLLPATAFAAFSDTHGHWGAAAAERWSSLGVVEGYGGTFRPDDPITRGEMAIIIDRIMRYKTVGANVFQDLGQAFLYRCRFEIERGRRHKGWTASARSRSIPSRGRKPSSCWGARLGLSEKDAPTVAFSDGAAISAWALGYVNAMADRGYVQGADGRFSPGAAITRASVVDDPGRRRFGTLQRGEGIRAADVSGTAVVNAPGAILKNMTIRGDLIIAEGVGSGDVDAGSRDGSGEHLRPRRRPRFDSYYRRQQPRGITIEKTDAGEVRVVNVGRLGGGRRLCKRRQRRCDP